MVRGSGLLSLFWPKDNSVAVMAGWERPIGPEPDLFCAEPCVAARRLLQYRNELGTSLRREYRGFLKNPGGGRAGGGADLSGNLERWVARGQCGGAGLRRGSQARAGGCGVGLGRRGFRLCLSLSLGRREFDPAAEFTRKKTQRGGEGGGEAETVAGDDAGKDGAGEGFERGVIHHRHALEDFQDDDADDCIQAP